MENNSEISIEETFKMLDEIIQKMEDKDTSLEESFAAYEQGMKLIQNCSESLDRVEKRIELIHKQTAVGNQEE